MEVFKCAVTELEINVDIGGFDRNLRELLFEVQRKRILLEEYRQELNESTLKQQDLERQLTNEKHKNSHEAYHRIILQNGAEALEEDRQRCIKEQTKLKVQLELAVAERDSLRNQVRSQCLEINNLKRTVDDLSSKHKCHSGFQKDLTDQIGKIKNSLNQVNDLMNPLKKKQEDLDSLCQMTNISEQLLMSAKQIEKQKNIAERERAAMERQLILKSAELSKLRQLLENSTGFPKNFENSMVLDYWKDACQYLESQLRIEKDGTAQLTNALKVSHENEEYLRKKLQQKDKKYLALEVLRKDVETQTNEQIIEIVDLVKSEPETE